ncbi:MAG: metallophosphoesterase [Wolbachia endosymbiont of Menacanthus eurysternus]|nr:MAG: metallophosphoesterase [Wolbachia endosymbiont of Menacanthus eurysternus]
MNNNTFVPFIIFILFLTNNFRTTYAQILYAWSQVIPENKLSVRAIVDNNTCPIINIDTKKIKMLNRSSNNYNETVCEMVTEINARNINIDNRQISTLPKKFNKIAFIGDTGCKINAFFQQECNSINSWPLKKNLDSIASHKPDLIVHVGDYHYRRAKCRNKQKCNNIYGYNKETWYADWFEPAKDILSQFSFLFIRGNHENCNRAHEGWFKYLDPYPFSYKKCENFIPSWLLDIGPIRFLVFDSSSGEDTFTTKNTIDIVEKQSNKLIHNSSYKPIWLLTHKPIWGLTKKELLTLKIFSNSTQIKIFKNKLLNNITTIISGHIHIAQILLMANAPDQIIVGNGGALLYSQDQKHIYQNIKFNHPNNKIYLAHEIRTFSGFGFAILNLNNRKFTFYNQNNEEIHSVQLTKNFEFKQ